jgi:ribonucleoside-diphosphate reductase alpha chain
MENNSIAKKYQVTTRQGRKEPLDITIIRRRLEDLSFGLNFQYLNLDLVVLKVEQGIYDGIHTAELDNLAA